MAPHRTLLIACGALAKEIMAVLGGQGVGDITLTCLPADLHNRPEQIPERVVEKVRRAKDEFDRIFVLYGDCGTGGRLDAALEAEGVERIEGPHCYSFYAGHAEFEALAEEEIGSFYLTDYLVRHFDRLIIAGLGIDKHPELLDMYFQNYRRLVYLAQIEDPELDRQARAAAAKLGLEYVYRHTGYGELATCLDEMKKKGSGNGTADDRLLA